MKIHQLPLVFCILGTLWVPAALNAQSLQANSAQPAKTETPPVRNTKEWNLSKKEIAAKGYDVVAYFPEGGSAAMKGSKKIQATFKGVVYRFSSESNKASFLKNPLRYEPAYGGWCAWAMSKGSKTDINPKTFIVKNNRLYLFYNALFGNTKTDWLEGDHDDLVEDADTQWKTFTNESPPEPSSISMPDSP